MANETRPWKPLHSEVVKRLCDNLDKLDIKYADYLTEVRMHVGQDVNRQIDLVTIGGHRTRETKRGNVLTLFAVKVEPSQLFRTVVDALQQMSLYELALLDPSLYVVGEDRIEKLSNSLTYRRYLVIQRASWDEQKDLSEDEVEKLSEILALQNIRIITYDSKWKFKLEEPFGHPKEETTHYLGKAVKRQKRR